MKTREFQIANKADNGNIFIVEDERDDVKLTVMVENSRRKKYGSPDILKRVRKSSNVIGIKTAPDPKNPYNPYALACLNPVSV